MVFAPGHHHPPPRPSLGRSAARCGHLCEYICFFLSGHRSCFFDRAVCFLFRAWMQTYSSGSWPDPIDLMLGFGCRRQLHSVSCPPLWISMASSAKGQGADFAPPTRTYQPLGFSSANQTSFTPRVATKPAFILSKYICATGLISLQTGHRAFVPIIARLPCPSRAIVTVIRIGGPIDSR
jgi:hypothetical protein